MCTYIYIYIYKSSFPKRGPQVPRKSRAAVSSRNLEKLVGAGSGPIAPYCYVVREQHECGTRKKHTESASSAMRKRRSTWSCAAPAHVAQGTKVRAAVRGRAQRPKGRGEPWGDVGPGSRYIYIYIYIYTH